MDVTRESIRTSPAWLLLFLLQLISPGTQAETCPNIPSLSVQGQAEALVPADQVRMTFAVVTEDPVADLALEKNNHRMQAVTAALAKAGLPPEAYQTGHFQIYPLQSRPPRIPDGDWKPAVIGYRVSNSLQIRSSEIGKAGEFIQAAVDAGANKVDQVIFDLENPSAHRADVIARATANGMADAKALANAAEVNLGRISRLQLNNTSHAPHRVSMSRAAEGVALDAGTVPMDPGRVTVRANVTLTYAIQ